MRVLVAVSDKLGGTATAEQVRAAVAVAAGCLVTPARRGY